MWGGWLEFTLTYNGLLSGLLYGLYLPVDRFSVKSRQLATLRFASLTMLRLNSFLNNLMNGFLITSAFGLLVFSKQAKPSSLHQLILPFLYISPTLHLTFTLPTTWNYFEVNHYKAILSDNIDGQAKESFSFYENPALSKAIIGTQQGNFSKKWKELNWKVPLYVG